MSGSVSAKTRPLRVIAWLTVVAAALLVIAGAATWMTVSSNLREQHITVSQDASMFAGREVAGPLTAFSQAQVIEKHALAITGGKTYAELGQDDPLRDTAMTASFLRASLFTSVVAYGVATMAIGLGVIFALIGWALLIVARPTERIEAPAHHAAPPADAAP